MSATEYCPSCNEGIVWKCGSCEKENDRSVHTYHPGSDEIPKTVPPSLVGAIVCLTGGFTFTI
jgi:hypothetical protein